MRRSSEFAREGMNVEVVTDMQDVGLTTEFIGGSEKKKSNLRIVDSSINLFGSFFHLFGSPGKGILLIISRNLH